MHRRLRVRYALNEYQCETNNWRAGCNKFAAWTTQTRARVKDGYADERLARIADRAVRKPILSRRHIGIIRWIPDQVLGALLCGPDLVAGQKRKRCIARDVIRRTHPNIFS